MSEYVFGSDQYQSVASLWAGDKEKPNILSDITIRPRILDTYREVGNKIILDAGCGAGSISRAIASRGARVRAFDKSPNMIAKALSFPTDVIKYKIGDASEEVPFEEEFDGAVSSLVYPHLTTEQVDRSNRLVYQQLKRGGSYLVALAHPDLLNYKPTSRWISFYPEDAGRYYKEGDPVRLRVRALDGTVIPLEGYHHTIEFSITSLLKQGFSIEDIRTPRPTRRDHELYPEMFSEDDFEIPFWLIIITRKE